MDLFLAGMFFTLAMLGIGGFAGYFVFNLLQSREDKDG